MIHNNRSHIVQRDKESHQRDEYGSMEYADTAKVDHVAYNICRITEPQTIGEVLVSEHGNRQLILSTSH